MDEENLSSSSTNQIGLVSFLGFQTHLALGFFEQARKIYGHHNGTIYLFHSRDESLTEDQKERYLAVRGGVDNELRNNWKNFKIEDIILNNIWDLREAYRYLTTIPYDNCLVNVSAGPTVFATSAILWGMRKHSLIIGHVIERSDPSLVETGNGKRIAVFTFIDLRPYFYYVSVDRMSKAILKSISLGKENSVEILEFLRRYYEEDNRISLRLVQMRLRELSLHGLIKCSRRGKSNSFTISENLTNITSIDSLIGYMGN